MKMYYQMTTKKLNEFKRLSAEGMSQKKIAEALGMSHGTVRNWQKRLGMETHYSIKYFVFDKNTNSVIVSGSAKQCAGRLGVSLSYFYKISKKGTAEYYISLSHELERDRVN